MVMSRALINFVKESVGLVLIGKKKFSNKRKDGNEQAAKASTALMLQDVSMV